MPLELSLRDNKVKGFVEQVARMNSMDTRRRGQISLLLHIPDTFLEVSLPASKTCRSKSGVPTTTQKPEETRTPGQRAAVW